MDRNIFDKIADGYENFHLKESNIQTKKGTIPVSPKLKLILGWSLFALCCVIGYIANVTVFGAKEISAEEKEAVLEEDIALDEEHKTIVPYEKDAYEDLNQFIELYLNATTACDNETLSDMVTNPQQFRNKTSLEKKAQYITKYSNITVYTKQGYDEGSYIAFIVTNLTITGVNSSPYDILTLYVINGARGYLINNGTLSPEALEYIQKVKGDEDIQKIYRAISEKNAELMEEDASLREFYDIITRENVETNAAADQMTTTETTQEQSSEASTETTTTEATTTEAAAE